MSRLLHYQADGIELVLASHKAPAQVTGGRVTPRLVRFELTTPLGVKVRQVAALAEELVLSLRTPSCRVYRQEGVMQVAVPRSLRAVEPGSGLALLGMSETRGSGAANDDMDVAASPSRSGAATGTSKGGRRWNSKRRDLDSEVWE